MITCTICDYHYSENRNHCPTCGATDVSYLPGFKAHSMMSVGLEHPIVLAIGYERARQLPQSPRFFQLVD